MAQQNYYGAPSHQSQQQGYANYQTQRPASTGAAQNRPVSQSFQAYSQAYAPSGTSYNLSDYSYGSTTYGAGSGTTGAARNNASADLQNLAYASGLHDSTQRDNTQAATAKRALSPGQSQHVSYTSSSYHGYGQQQQSRPKSVNALAGRNNQRSPVVVSRLPNHPGLPLPKTTNQASNAQTYQWNHKHQTQAAASGSREFETVDPTQVYDPWPELKRKGEAARTAKALEERARAERERLEREKSEKEAGELRKAEEARLAEERRKAEDEEKAEQQRLKEERRKEAEKVQEQQKKANTKSKMSKAATAATSSSAQPASPDVEAQMRALMAQMRELNSQDPALLAKIWEEERRSHGQPSQVAQPATQSPKPTTKQPHKAPAKRKPPATQPQPFPGVQPPVSQTPPTVSQQQPLHQPPQAQRQHVRQQQPQPAAQPRSPIQRQPPSGTTAWPNDKKDQICKAASDWLNAVPENHDKQISPQEVCDLLNKNPRYIDLCEWLESQGMKLERGSFARALLSAVPNINKTQAQAPPPGPVNGNVLASPSTTSAFKGTGQPGPHNSQANYSNLPVNRPSTVGEHLQVSQSPYPPPEHTSFRSPYFVPTTAGASAPTQQPIPTPPPQVPVAPMPYARHDRQNSGSRQGSSQSEDSQKPATKADAARKRNFSKIVDLTQLSEDEEPPEKKRAGINNDIAPAWAAPPDNLLYARLPEPGNLHTLPTIVQVDDRTKNMDVVQPLNRKYALGRSTYEAKTIARDVLLATGKHPEMRPLNGHLEILRESFKKVDNTSDLSTLRWDLIDPGDPPPETLESDVMEIEDEDADDEEEDVPKEQTRPRPPQPTPKLAPFETANPASLQAIPSPSAPSIASLSMHKRRGRPPNQSASGAADARDARATPTTIRDRERERASSSTIGTPSAQSPMAANTKPIGYSAFRETQYGPDGTPLPKKKGRPVGWRKSIHSKEAQARAAGNIPQPASGSRPSGLRTSLQSDGVVLINSRSPSIVSPRKAPASYRVYKCQWENCAAELHNMETLRKHVFKFHNCQNATKKWPCYWAGCQENERSLDLRTGKPNNFSIFEDLKDHVEFAHLGPKSWELGDGHAGGLSESHGSASEAYLSDSRGRRVTPLIATSSKEAIEMAAAAAAPVARGPGRPKLKTDEQKAREAQADLEKKKKLIGPGLDRAGARLANEKRRMGFIDDEDFEQVVSDSE